MAIIYDSNNSFDERLGINIELNFSNFNGVRLLTGGIRNIDDQEMVIETDKIKIINTLKKVVFENDNKEDNWIAFYNSYFNKIRNTDYIFSDELMSVYIQITDSVVNNYSSVLRVGFNFCVLNGNIPWKGKGPILTEMVVEKVNLCNFINKLNEEYKECKL